MRTAREDVGRPDGGVGRAVRNRARPPIWVVVGVASLVPGTAWIEAFERPVLPTLNIDFGIWRWLLFAALVVGTMVGVRILWAFTVVFTFAACAGLLTEVVGNPTAQAMGGWFFLTVAVAHLLLPSTQQFEQRRIRLVLV